MLPTIIARQLREGFIDYLKALFPITTPGFAESFTKMLEMRDAVFHEPYVAVRLPFRLSEEGQESEFFKSVHLGRQFYVHQRKAFERLVGDNPASTLVATGTGSGKTECFLLPVLEHCFNHRAEKGIKALLIYPMNALAADQAKRIGELIYNSSELRGEVTAGMYVGDQDYGSGQVAMTEHGLITDHEAMLSSPPDILLTNYKMLDLLLVRPKDSVIWKFNKPETLKFIVVDEIHTFDGAQGTDLACLLRRLKSRLDTPKGHLCCVGTSATMGSADQAGGIIRYASELFGDSFEPDSVITEDRLSTKEFLAETADDSLDFTIPDSEALSELLSAIEESDPERFLLTAAKCWFDEETIKSWSNEGYLTDFMGDKARLALGHHLKRHVFTRTLLPHVSGGLVQIEAVFEALGHDFPELLKYSIDFDLALEALLALISHARAGDLMRNGPFLTVQCQFWVRELRRLVATISNDDISFAMAADLTWEQAGRHLPVINCRDCGATGWISIINERGSLKIGQNLPLFYSLFFNNDTEQIKIVYPRNQDDVSTDFFPAFLCPVCLKLDISENPRLDSASDRFHNCSSCGTPSVPVEVPRKLIQRSQEVRGGEYPCPHCGSPSGLTLMGMRGANAISSLISQLFASKYNDDKKTLAFSDSVQDAAHRSGFFNSRTYRFTLRKAIQHFALASGEDRNLHDFTNDFIRYWHKETKTEEAFITRFIAPNMVWLRAYEEMLANGRLGGGQLAKDLKGLIEKRLNYEIMLEYGLFSQFGWALERSEASVLYFDADLVSRAAEVAALRAVNESGLEPKPSNSLIFRRIAAGTLNLMRLSGAFADPVFNGFTSNDGVTYLLSNDRIRWLPGRNQLNTPRFPLQSSFVKNAKLNANFDNIFSNNKYKNLILKSLPGLNLDPEIYNKIIKIIFYELAETGLVASMPSQHECFIWGLSKDKALVSKEVRRLTCDRCGQSVRVGEANADFWEGAPCPKSKCQGALGPARKMEPGYFGRLYSSGDLVRISAKEHTGLLPRKEREALESVFKKASNERLPWDVNVLSCTPTLELGIDIGDLSSIFLCGVPPNQSSFLQRTGRAGRRDGNALTIVSAASKPHDLYFYAEPPEMIAGEVKPPKVFLKAAAVLERQFTAYCFDRWIKDGVAHNAVPQRLGACLSALRGSSRGKFPFSLEDYLGDKTEGLFEDFTGLFPELGDSEKESLKTYAEKPLDRLIEAMKSLNDHRDWLKVKTKETSNLIREFKAKPSDPSFDKKIEEFNDELSRLTVLISDISKKNVFNFLCDEGILPNYAFPESNIALKAILTRKYSDNFDNTSSLNFKNKDNLKNNSRFLYEYNRSSSAALSELAPSNYFYASGRKLKIDQVDMSTAQVEKWRLCPNCPHAEKETFEEVKSQCPVCHSPLWADAGQLRSLIKVKTVYSNMDYTKNLIGDNSDSRESVFYNKQFIIYTDEANNILRSYSIKNDKFNFTYEFVKKAILREINFGELGDSSGTLLLNGQDIFNNGFVICQYCGKIQSNNGKPRHAYTCPARQSSVAHGAHHFQDPEKHLFLQREFASEALKILIPATTLDPSDTIRESFIAAFVLGLREYFGNVDHLNTSLVTMPLEGTDLREQYLVVYDSVPGGTGYLQQLTHEKHSLIDILEKSLNVLEKCSCQDDPLKDGCYRCLFAHRSGYKNSSISRRAAIDLLRQILSGKGNLKEMPVGSGGEEGKEERDKDKFKMISSLFQSELERLFIESLSKAGSPRRPVSVSNQLVSGKEGFSLKVGKALWEIEPQVKLGELNGVSVATIPDFVFWPVGDASGRKPVAVYTDGITYHRDNLDDDSLKRMAVMAGGRFRVWTFSWKDVRRLFEDKGEHSVPSLAIENMPGKAANYVTALKGLYPAAASGSDSNAGEKTSPFDFLNPPPSPIELLMRYLETEDAERVFASQAKAVAFALLNPPGKDESEFDNWRKEVSNIQKLTEGSEEEYEFGQTLFGVFKPGYPDCHEMTVLAGIPLNELASKQTFEEIRIRVYSVLDDLADRRSEEFQRSWNGFWHFANLMQFSGQFKAVTRKGLEDDIYERIAPVPPVISGVPPSGWDEIIELISDEAARKFAGKCRDLNAPPPDTVGFELVGEDEEIAGEAEMAWETFKIALLLPWQIKSEGAFASLGWRIVFPENDPQTEWFTI